MASAQDDPHVRKFAVAVKTLYEAADPEKKHEANRWLMDFLSKDASWHVSDQVLGMNGEAGVQVTFMAAVILKLKIIRHFRVLSEEAKGRLRERVVAHLRQYGQRNKVVLSKISEALALIAMQMPSWENVVQDVVRMCQGSPNMLSVLVDLLTVLPAQIDNPSVPVPLHRRDAFSKQLAKHSLTVLRILQELMHKSGNDRQLQERIFKALSVWVRFGNIPRDELLRNPMFEYAFQALRKEDLFIVAADVLTEFVRLTPDDRKEFRGVAKEVCRRVLQSKEVIALHARNDFVECSKAACRLMVEVVESYRQFLCEGDEVAVDIVRLMVVCTSAPTREVLRIAMYGWEHMLPRFLDLRYHREMPDYDGFEKASVATQDGGEETKRQLQCYGSIMLDLIGVLRDQLHRPEDWDQYGKDERTEYHSMRYSIAGVLDMITRFLGEARMLEHCVNVLVQQVGKLQSGGSWVGIDAALYVLKGVGKLLMKTMTEESIHIPILMDIIHKLPRPEPLVRTTTLLLGELGDWLNRHPKYLPASMEYITKAYNNENTASAAAWATKRICRSCSHHLKSEMKVLLHIFDAFPKLNSLVADDFRDIVEGICSVALSFEWKYMGQIVGHMWTTTCTHLTENLRTSMKKVTEHLVTLQGIVNSLNIHNLPADRKHPVIELIQRNMDVIEQLAELYGGEEKIMDNVVELFQLAMGAAGKNFARHLLLPYMQFLSTMYKKHPLWSFLDGARHCVKSFGKSGPEVIGPFREFFSVLGQRTLVHMQSPKAVEESADLMDAYFSMSSVFLRRCPVTVVTSSAFPRVLDMVIASLDMRDRLSFQHVLSSVLSFFQNLAFQRDPEFRGNLLLKQTTRDVIVQMDAEVHRIGPMLVSRLMRNLCTSLAPYHREVEGNVVDLLRLLAIVWEENFRAWLQKALQDLPERIMNRAGREAVYGKIVGMCGAKLRSSQATREFDRLVALFADECRCGVEKDVEEEEIVG